jgi:hypothetical protein
MACVVCTFLDFVLDTQVVLCNVRSCPLALLRPVGPGPEMGGRVWTGIIEPRLSNRSSTLDGCNGSAGAQHETYDRTTAIRARVGECLLWVCAPVEWETPLDDVVPIT